MAEISDDLYDALGEWISENHCTLLTDFEPDERLDMILKEFGDSVFNAEEPGEPNGK